LRRGRRGIEGGKGVNKEMKKKRMGGEHVLVGRRENKRKEGGEKA
jgi:hypothetical protein